MLDFRLVTSALLATVALILIGFRLFGSNEAAAGLVRGETPRIELSIMEKPMPTQRTIPVPAWVAPPPAPAIDAPAIDWFAAIDIEQDTILESGATPADETTRLPELASIGDTERTAVGPEDAAETATAIADPETATTAVVEPEAPATAEIVKPQALANADNADIVNREETAPEVVAAPAEIGIAGEIGSGTSDESAPEMTGSIAAVAALSAPPPEPVARPAEIPPVKRVVRRKRRAVRPVQPAPAAPAAEKNPFVLLAEAIEKHRERLEAAAQAAKRK